MNDPVTMVDFMRVAVPAVMGAASGAIAAYTAIRADLKAHGARIAIVEDRADDAHKRIDTILVNGAK